MICESGPTVTHFRPCLETGGNWMHTRQPDTFTDNMEAVTCTHCLYLLRDRADRVDAEDGGR